MFWAVVAYDDNPVRFGCSVFGLVICIIHRQRDGQATSFEVKPLLVWQLV